MKIQITALALLALFCSCGNGPKFRPSLPLGETAADVPSYVIENFKMTSSEAGSVRWNMRAKAAQVFELKRKAHAQSVYLETFDSEGKKTILTCKRAVINTDTYFLEAEGSVKVRAPNRIEVHTEKLFWDEKKQIFYTDAPVAVFKEGSVLRGIGLESDREMTNLKILKGVRLKAEVPGNEE
jgi:LPS export ABC transporter protein LptC